MQKNRSHINPSVSVLMSVFNGEKYLRRAIESILAQTFADFEFIIVNDGSTDSSRDISASYNDPRIRLIDNPSNMGLTRSLNKGIGLARGAYIARMDADDVSLPRRLEMQHDFLASHDDIAVCGCWTNIIDVAGEKLREARMETISEIIGYRIFLGNQIVHASMMAKTNLMKAFKYDERYRCAQDYELWFRFLHSGYRLSNVPAFLFCYRNTASNISSAFASDQERYAIKALHYWLNRSLNIRTDLKTLSLFRRFISTKAMPLSTRQASRLETYVQDLSEALQNNIQSTAAAKSLKHTMETYRKKLLAHR